AVFESLGADVVETDPELPDSRHEFEVLWYSGAAKATEKLTDRERDLLDPGLREIIEEGLTYDAQDYLTAMALRMDMGAQMGLFHTEYALLLTPAATFPAIDAVLEWPPAFAGPVQTFWSGTVCLV